MNDPVVWVRVPPPTFDLVGVVLSSLGLAGFLRWAPPSGRT